MVIDANGEYELMPGNKKPKTSEHPVYQARIEIALPVGGWLFAPNDGHNLARFSRAANTAHKREEFQKELSLYLKKYGPVVTDLLVGRNAVEIDMTIAQGALNV